MSAFELYLGDLMLLGITIYHLYQPSNYDQYHLNESVTETVMLRGEMIYHLLLKGYAYIQYQIQVSAALQIQVSAVLRGQICD